MRLIAARTGLVLAFPLFASAASAQERCVAGEFRLPASIADEMRPYLLCGLIQGDRHFTVRLNGRPVSMSGGGVDSCRTVRSRAFESSERRLAPIMRDDAARRDFLEAEFEKADLFLRVAAGSQDLAVGEEPSAPLCRNRDAQH